MRQLVAIVCLSALAGCYSVRIESACADSDITFNIPAYIVVRTCSTTHPHAIPNTHHFAPSVTPPPTKEVPQP